MISVVDAQTREEALLDSLYFPELQLREYLVEPAHNGTCNWLHDAKAYRLWQERNRDGHQNRLLWIKGKAGSGKSTLMLHELSSMRQQSRGSNASNQMLLSHFFNARGTGLEMTAQGLYRTLLYQVLKKCPQLLQELCSSDEYWVPPTSTAWPVPRLRYLLSTILSWAPYHFTVLFVDAVDECVESDIADMIYGFDELVKQTAKSGKNLRVCFASRHSVTDPVDSGIFLTLEDQASHRDDVAKYIRGKLHIIQKKEGRLAEEIRSVIEEKASGVFLWVKLVVDSLNEDYRGGHLRNMRQRLVEIPGDLQKLYLEMVVSSEQIDEFLMVVRILLSCEKIKLGRIWLIVQLCMKRACAEISREHIDHRPSTLQNWLSNTSRGLIECKDRFTGETLVQFIHETARGFAMSESGLLHLFGVRSQQELEKQTLELLKDAYTKALQAQNEMISLLPPELLADGRWLEMRKEVTRSLSPEELSVLRLVASEVLEHAETLQRIGVDQEAWMAEFTTRCGLAFALIYGDFVTILHGLDSQAFIINALILQGYDHLIRHTQLQPAREARAAGLAFGFSPIIFNFYSMSIIRSLHALVDIYLRLDDHRPAMVQTVLEQLARTWQGSPPVPQDIDATARANNIDLGRIVEDGFLSTVRFLGEHRLQPIGLEFDFEDNDFHARWAQKRTPP
ncbi:hypothetical protein CC79DRAFT_1354854 [Sarocladium strictum]